ncbi:MAG TPA: c-type cytochrome [Solimonas sp.]|nr:c-type cytochrome [Solimonas sp.]
MDHKNHDQVFFVNFGKVMGGLFLIFFICMGAAAIIDTGDGHADENANVRLEERIKPAGTVVTDPNVLMAMQAANKPARAAYTGDEVLTKVCGACHDSGVLNAPKTSDKAAWSARKGAAGGLDGLVKSAIAGKAQMPPRGGDADLSDDEVKAAVEALLKKSGA